MTKHMNFPMTWEQAVEWLRRQPDQETLVKRIANVLRWNLQHAFRRLFRKLRSKLRRTDVQG